MQISLLYNATKTNLTSKVAMKLRGDCNWPSGLYSRLTAYFASLPSIQLSIRRSLCPSLHLSFSVFTFYSRFCLWACLFFCFFVFQDRVQADVGVTVQLKMTLSFWLSWPHLQSSEMTGIYHHTPFMGLWIYPRAFLGRTEQPLCQLSSSLSS